MFKRSKKILSIALAMFLVVGIFIPSAVKAESGNKIVPIYSLNDFHGAVSYQEGRTPGMARIVGYGKTLKEENPNAIFVSAGDSYQGTAMSNLLFGKPVSDMFRLLGVEASAIGNHEFDWGVDPHFKDWEKDGGFPFLAANIVEEDTGQPVTWAEPYKIVERDGIKIAFIGLAHEETDTLTKREHIEGIKFTSATEAVKKWIEYLEAGKADEGRPDAIIALTHIDSYQDEMGESEVTGNVEDLAGIKGLDGVISGHSHRRVYGDIKETPIAQGGSNGYNFAVLNLEFDKNNKLVDVEADMDDMRGKIEELPIDKEAEKIFKKYEDEVRPVLDKKIGVAEGEFTHDSRNDNVTLLGRWSSEVMRDYAGTQIAIQNGGGLRRTLEAGDITMSDMYEIMPFDNTLITFDLSGKDLRAAIDLGINNPNVGNGQFVGVVVEYDASRPFQDRITKITLEDGTPIEDDKYYSVATNDFLLTGGDNYDFSRAENVVNTYVPIRDVLVEAIEEEGTITPVEVDYLTQVGSPAMELNKTEGLVYIEGYEDNTIKPEGKVTREEASMVLYRLLEDDYRESIKTDKNEFTDIKDGRWSTEAILSLANGGILNGYEDGSFKPANHLTRQELMVIISKFSDLEEAESTEFTDVKEGSWSEEYINIAVAEGWVKGYEDNTFNPKGKVTRAEFITIMNRVLGRDVKDYKEVENVIEFKDLDKNKWYYNDIIEATFAG